MPSASTSSDHEHHYMLISSGVMRCSCGREMSYDEWERMWKEIGG